MKDIFLKYIINIKKQKYLIFRKTYHSYQKKIEKVKKLVCSIEDKEKYVVPISALKQALNHRLIVEKVHRINQFNQKSWFEPCIDVNNQL